MASKCCTCSEVDGGGEPKAEEAAATPDPCLRPTRPGGAPPAGRCVTADVDLEALAAAYRHRTLSSAGRRRAEDAVGGLAAGAWVLDVGGGPGDHAAVWRDLGHRAIVLDPSLGMTTSASHHHEPYCGSAFVGGYGVVFQSGTD